MAEDKRPLYYNGQFLQEQDLNAGQEYHLDRQRRHNRQLHTYGIAEGLTVTADVGATSAIVSPGTALDGEGRQIVLTQSRNVPFGSFSNQSVLVVISYNQQPADPATVGDAGDTRWWERPDVEVISEAGAPAADARIRLARLQIAGNGTVSQHDTSVRSPAGVRPGAELALERIRLKRQGVDSSQWPVLSSGAASQADVAGSLSVTGNVLVTGTVDGRDVAADGASLDSHKARTDNPHGTTAAQVGAITGVGGVSNPGGQVAILAGNNISITPDSANNRITIASSTLEGVSNPGGNIDLVGQAGITITGDNTTKKINFTTSPAAIGALATTDYLRRAFVTVLFNQTHASNTTQLVNTGFQPKLAWLTGRSFMWFANNQAYGGPLGGFCHWNDAGSLVQAWGHGPVVHRLAAAPYFSFYNEPNSTYSQSIAFINFWDQTVTPTNLHIRIFIQVVETTSTGFKLKIVRESETGTLNFAVEMGLLVLG